MARKSRDLRILEASDGTTTLGQIFKDCPPKWAQHHPYQVHELREKDSALMGYVLMACAAEQTHFLSALWAYQFFPDEDTVMAWKALVNIGAIVDLMDVTNFTARQRFKDTYNGIVHARGKM